MILGIDAHKAFSHTPTGTDIVSDNFILRLNSDHCHSFDKIYLYTKKPIEPTIINKLSPNISNKIITIPFFWSSVGLSWNMFFNAPDILFVPSHSLPFILPNKTATIIHDIGFLEYPDNYSPKQYLHLEKTTKIALKKASVIITPSEFVKKSLIDRYYADPNKIHTIHLGVDSKQFHPNFSHAQVNTVLKKYHPKIMQYPFILYLGRIEPRKNIFNLLTAFAMFKKKFNYPHILVLAGKQTPKFSHIKNLLKDLNIDKDVIVTEYIKPSHLPIFYSEAEIFLFPSLYEGFGLPILEAQACHCPVITSNLTAMPEIAGEGAILVNPHDADQISGTIKKLIDNPSLKQKIIEKGILNIRKYSWDLFYEKVMENLIKLGKKL